MPRSADAPEAGSMVASRVRSIRAARGLTLDGLASASGVSRAMLSRIERGESSPTAALLLKLCGGLGVTPMALLGGDAGDPEAPLVRRAQQPVWRDPGSGYLRRTVSPAGPGSRVEIAEVELPAGIAVVLDCHDQPGREQQIWVLDGVIEVTRRGAPLRLGPGDRLRLDGDGPTGIRNAGPGLARYAAVGLRTGRDQAAP